MRHSNFSTIVAGGFAVWAAASSSAATFSTTGSLGTGRIAPAAVLLSNGQVLVAGGRSGSTTLSSAETYDPATGIFTPTVGTMSSARGDQATATALPDGRILIAGGNSGIANLNTAETYDASSRSFTAVAAPMGFARSHHTATLLPNGKVLLAGGIDASGTPLASAEIYDPASGAFTATTGVMTHARQAHAATLLGDGTVLITGGSDAAGPVDVAETFDPAAGTFTATAGPMNSARSGHTATLLSSGQVLIAGGFTTGQTPTAAAERYDPVTLTFPAASIASMNVARARMTATLVPSGSVLLVGGVADSSGTLTSSAEIYDPAGGFTLTGSGGPARQEHAAVGLASGLVLVAGGDVGSAGSPSPSSDARTYDPGGGSFASTAGTMKTPRERHTATLLPDGTVLLAGGVIDGSFTLTPTAETFDPATGTFTATANPMTTARIYHTATLLSDGRVLVVGGDDGSGFTNLADLYDPAMRKFSPTGPLMTEREGLTATLLPDGRVLVAGGHTSSGFTASAELFDPAAGTFSPIASLMSAPRHGHTATLLPDGRVLLTGGNNGGGYTNSADLFDPTTATFAATGSMNSFRLYQKAILLPNGGVLVAGGYALTGPTNTAEIYDPATGVFTLTAGTMVFARQYLTAALLPGGQALIVGGDDGNGPLREAEVFDPRSTTFTAAPGLMASARGYLTATLLASGKVLIAGGYDASGIATNTAETFDVGLGYPEVDRPHIFSAPTVINLPSKLSLTGDNFRKGDSDSYPLVQFLRVDNNESFFLSPDPSQSWSDSGFTSDTLAGLPDGHYRATVVAGGVPSSEELITVTCPAPLPPFVTLAFGSNPGCAGASITLDAGAGYSAYLWSNGATTQTITVAPTATTTYTVTGFNAAGCRSSAGSFTEVLNPPPVISAPSATSAGTAGLTASVPATANTIVWSIVNGTPTGGQGTPQITFTAGSPGLLTIEVDEKDSFGCAVSPATATVVVNAVAARFYTVAPCRLIDTRGPPGPSGGPALSGNGVSRDFAVDGNCGVPLDAVAVSANVTVVKPTASGDLRLYPSGIPAPLVSTINFPAGRTRANSVVLPLIGSPLGTMTVRCEIPAGSANFLFDVNGFFR